jgi:hypothetical protein
MSSVRLCRMTACGTSRTCRGRVAMSAIRVSTDLARTGTEVGWALE